MMISNKKEQDLIKQQIVTIKDVWTRRAESFLEMFGEICAIEGWDLNTETLQRHGRFVGLCVWHDNPKNKNTDIHPQLTSMLQTLPGMKSMDKGPILLDHYGVVIASEQHDVFCLPIAIDILKNEQAA